MSEVRSSNLSAIGYDSLSRTLAVRFNRGHIYHYFDVPPEIFEGLRSALSKGEYFHAHIRNVFPFEQIG
jgi:hypothetical protein